VLPVVAEQRLAASSMPVNNATNNPRETAFVMKLFLSEYLRREKLQMG
jgi:hypothetical protein